MLTIKDLLIFGLIMSVFAVAIAGFTSEVMVAPWGITYNNSDFNKTTDVTYLNQLNNISSKLDSSQNTTMGGNQVSTGQGISLTTAWAGLKLILSTPAIIQDMASNSLSGINSPIAGTIISAIVAFIAVIALFGLFKIITGREV